MKLFSQMDNIHTSEEWIEDTLTLCKEENGELKKDRKTHKITRKYKKIYTVMAATFALAVILPLSTAAASRIRNMSVTNNDRGAEVIVNRPTIAVADIVPMKIVVNYIPDGMVRYLTSDKYYNVATPNQGGFSLRLWRLDGETQEFQFPVDNAISSQEMDVNGYEAVLLQKSQSNQRGIPFDRQMFIYYADKGYVIQVYIGNDMSMDQINAFTSGLSLEQCNEDAANGTWNSYITQKEAESQVITIDMPKKTKIGDVINKKTFTEIYNINQPLIRNNISSNSSVQQIVKHVSVQKNFDGILTDQVGRPSNFNSFLKADGQLLEDGYSIVIVDLQYKNISNADLKYEICICPYIESLKEENDQFIIQATKTGADDKSKLFELGFNEGFFSFTTDVKGSHNEVAPLSAGQVANVTLAFLVKDEYLKSMFLVQNKTGWDIIDSCQYMDIRQE